MMIPVHNLPSSKKKTRVVICVSYKSAALRDVKRYVLGKWWLPC